MDTKLKNILTISLTGAVIAFFTLFGIFKSSEKYSMSERRALEQAPKLTAENLLSGKYMTDFEVYSADQFPLRETFRTVKAVSTRYIFRQKDDHDIYISNGHMSKLEYPVNTERLDRSLSKLCEVYDAYVSGTDCKPYVSVVPDKNRCLAPMGRYPDMDYDKMTDAVKDKLDFAEYIDIFDLLTLDSYYKTDGHWSQEKIIPVAERICSAMGTEISFSDLKECSVEAPFYGVYCGQAALKLKPDVIRYMASDALEACTVTNYNKGKATAAVMYDLEKAEGRDPYEMYLEGSTPIITVENPSPSTTKELVLFRDSFGSSLAPLLAKGYAKITLVDLRYIRSDILSEFIDFDSQDVLFIYSTAILNNTLSQ